MTVVDPRESRLGVICGILSYGLWGLMPLYFKLVQNVPPVEVLAQRVLWAFALLALVVTALGRWGDLIRAITTPRILAMLAASTMLLAINWFTYIYAVSSNQVVEASLGYFLNPLVNVLIGVALLKERMRSWQIASVALAALGVAILGVPLIAVTIAVTFAFYGLLRRTVAVDGLSGLLIETVLLLPIALVYIAYLTSTGQAAFTVDDPTTCLKLMASGPVTAVPLLLFAAAARRLRFSTLGFLQYLAPSVQFFLAVTFFDEQLTPIRWAAMGCIWTAVAVYTADSLHWYHQQRREPPPPEPADV